METNEETNEIEAIRAALAKANEEAKTFRLENKELKTQMEALQEQVSAAEQEKTVSTIESKLKENNLPVSFAKYMTLEDIDSQISELKETMSFNEDAAEKPAVNKPKSMGELLMDSIV